MIDKLDRNKCTGCKACGDICPKKAISYEIDDEGFWFPIIEKSKCVGCNLCEKACPALNRAVGQNSNYCEPKAIAAYSLEDYVRYKSTSGGMFYEIARSFIERGDYVAGCVFTDDFRGAKHIVTNTLAGLKRIMQTKYFQSDTEGIFIAVREILDAGRRVLFCGVPCQVAALQNFLGKEYCNLYTLDLICRAISTPLAYHAFTDELIKKYGAPITSVRFKDKRINWISLTTRIKFANGKEYEKDRIGDPWLNAFLGGNLYVRKSCANCNQKGFPRVGDLTLGDFWGLKFNKKDVKLGISLVLVNNLKGEYLIDSIKEKIYIEDHSLDEAIRGNPALIKKLTLGAHREEFFRRIKTEKYSEVIWSIVGLPWPKWWLREKKYHLKEFIKDLLFPNRLKSL